MTIKQQSSFLTTGEKEYSTPYNSDKETDLFDAKIMN